MEEIVKVGMADMNLCSPPKKITTIGLGSCVGVVLYDEKTKICALLHIMLPDSTKIKNNTNRAKFADTAIDDMIETLSEKGAFVQNLIAKIAGGAQMFASSSGVGSIISVGEQNIEAVKKKLKDYGIDLVAEDTGLNYGRTIVFDPSTGGLLIKAVGKEEKTI